MLTTSLLSIWLTLLLTKMKNSWELMILTISWSTFITFMLMPFLSYPHQLTNNFSSDMLSLSLIFMTMWITQMMMMASYYVKDNKKSDLFKFLCMIMMMTLILSFTTNNLILFYILFELSLIPILTLISIWGHQPERKIASVYIMMYTITASLPMLLSILKLINNNHTLNFLSTNINAPHNINTSILWIMLMLAFLVKLPMFMTHMWLPKAHVEAPVGGSMFLAAILLKLGGYGIMRINKFMNQMSFYPSLILMLTAIIGGIITNMLSVRQVDLKALIAYSSIGHMALLVIASLSNSKIGQYGALTMMISHGLSSSCMFMLTGDLYNNFYSRSIILINTPINLNPPYSLAWTFVIMGNMALPPNLNILSEILIMSSSFSILPSMILLLMISSFSTAIYSIYLYSMINHGNMLKMSNPIKNMKSATMIMTFSHLWPLLVFSSLPTKLINWC